jgi:hypothetical protein
MVVLGFGLLAVALIAALIVVVQRSGGQAASPPSVGSTTTSGDPAGSVGSTPTSEAPAVEQPGVPATPPADLKAPIVGLLDRQGEPATDYGLAGWVVKTSWAELQPAPGGPIVRPNAIDTALARARELGMVLKLRIYTGTQAPDWAKQLGGGPVPLVDPNTGGRETVGRFWTEEFGRAYADLQVRLAALYDQVAEIREIVISRCTTIFAEPFIRQTSIDANLSTLGSAGLDDERDLRCFKEQVDAHDVWKRTRSDLAVNPYQSIEAKSAAASGGSRVRGGDLAMPEQVMRYCRQRLGARCILENNSLRADPSPQYVQLYEVMEGLGKPLAFQTATGDKVGDLAETVAMAADLGAASVELPISYRRTPPRDLGEALAPGRSRLSA